MHRDLYSFARQQGLNERRAIDVSSGISPLGPSKKVKASIRKAIKDIHTYPDPALSKLRRFFSSKFRLAEEGLLFANSMEELIHLIPAVLRPKKVVVAGLSPGLYEEASAAAGAAVSNLFPEEKKDFDLDIDMVRGNLDDVDLLFISNPNRITGGLADREKLYETLKYAASKKVVVVLDESLIEFTEDHGYHGNISSGDNIVVLRTTGYFYGLPGLELAYAVSSASLINELGDKIHWNVNTLAVEAAKTALKDRAYQKQTRIFVETEKRFLMGSLRKIKGITCYESGSNMLLIKLEYPEEKLLKSLGREGFFIRDSAEIRGLDRSFLRLSIMGHDKNKKLLRILKSEYP
jgi:threonine-phosphate decarboxylase